MRLAALMEISVDLRLHARLDRPRRGRPDPPAGRAAGAPARRSRTSTACGRPTPTRPRSPGSFALEQTRDARRRSCSAARGCRSGTRTTIPDDAIDRGAYVLRESSKDEPDADPDRHRLRGAHLHRAPPTLLEADGIATRVVSVPCLDRFAEQDDDYRDSVLPPAVRARVSVEAAATTRLEHLDRPRTARRSA